MSRKKRKRTRNQLILEELGCPHRWNKYARKNQFSHKGKCIDCGKSRFVSVSTHIEKGAPRSKHSFTWNEKPLGVTDT